jgi:hypothetical protein
VSLVIKIKKRTLIAGLVLTFLVVILAVSLGYVLSSAGVEGEDKRDFSKGVFSRYLMSPTPTPKQTVKIGLVGDLALGRTVTVKARNERDFSGFLKGMEGWLSQNDINIGNLEGPVIKNCPSSREGMTFCGDIEFLDSLSRNRMVFSLANNHILNYGSTGFWETTDLLDKKKIAWVYSHKMPEDKLGDGKYEADSGEFLAWEKNGIRVGILGWDLSGGHWYQEEEIIKKVEEYSQGVNWLIVNLHWGAEYVKEPEEWRVELAHKLIKAGVDIIQGHHPHVVQKTEEYEGGIIYYSLGNFVFDQMWSEETRTGKVVELELSESEILKREERRIKIYDYWQPRLEN